MDILIDTIIDNLKLFPFLFITYLCLEYMEHKTANRVTDVIRKAKFSGPLLGSICGLLPQCGFSVAAANFYAARVIGLGTLLAIYLSTSDEMLPIFISQAVSPLLISKILIYKAFCAVVFGYTAMFISLKYQKSRVIDIEQLCKNENCHCDEGILRPALHHSLNIAVFIFAVSLCLNYAVSFFDVNGMAKYLQIPLFGEMLSGFLGLIPNCSPSVILSQFYLDGYISVNMLISGTLVNSGVGILMLFRVNRHLKENLKIVTLLYVCGIIGGLCSNFFEF